MSLIEQPISYHNGDSATDNTGNGNNFTLSNVSIETTIPLVGNESFSFNGIDSHGKFTLPASFKTQRFCVRAFIELDSTWSGSGYIFVAEPSRAFGLGKGWFFRVTATRQLQFFVGDASNGFIFANGGTTLNTGTKYFVEGDYDGNNVTVYLNTVQDGQTAFTGTVDWIDDVSASPVPATFYMGAARDSTAPINNIPNRDFFNGLIEGGVWDEARNSSDSSFIYNNGVGREYPFITAVKEFNPNASKVVQPPQRNKVINRTFKNKVIQKTTKGKVIQ